MASKIGRNAPCPCGSGKKYKKCCLAADEADARKVAPAPPSHDDGPTGYGAGTGSWGLEPDELDELSNGVLDLIHDGRFDEADALCARLREEYPDVVDGVWRQAMAYEARGMNREAARCYREAAAFARANDGFEETGIQQWLDTADRLDPPADT